VQALLYFILLVGTLAAWPLLVFALCRYRLRLTRYRSYLFAITLVPIALVTSIAFGEYYAATSSAIVFAAFYVLFFLPYFIMAIWLTDFFIRRSRHSAARRQV
jgi:hypothetical protein